MASRTTGDWPTATPTKKSYFWWVLGAALLIGAVVAYNNRRRLAEAMGMSVVNQQQQQQPRQRAPRRRGAQVAEATVPTVTPTIAAPVTAAIPGCDASMPKPFNVYQDNLSGSNDITVGPGATFDGAGAVPTDYSGQCSGVNPAAVWQSTQLLPSANCGQSLEGTSDWSTFAPSDPSVVNFLSAGFNNGVDTISTSLKNASLDLRPEPAVSNTFQSPWNQSSYVQDSQQRADWSHSLVA